MLKFVANEEKYFEFIRNLRNHKETQKGFIEQVNITAEQQKEYMKTHKNNYFICLYEEKPVGYIGVIEEEIRIATHPNYLKKGIGLFMLKELLKIKPKTFAIIKEENMASLNLFKKAGYVYHEKVVKNSTYYHFLVSPLFWS